MSRRYLINNGSLIMNYYLIFSIWLVPIPIFEHRIINRADFMKLQAITQFKEEGILAFNNKVNVFIKNTDNESFTVSISDRSRISAKIDLNLSAIIKFKQTIEPPFFIGYE